MSLHPSHPSSPSSPPLQPTPILLLDGGLGTTLQSLAPTTPLSASLWSSTPLLTDPTLLLKTHTAFVTAGADILETATYQASLPAFASFSISSSDATTAMRDAVALARAAARTRRTRNHGPSRGPVQVALSLGPYGATTRPSCEYMPMYDGAHSGREALRRWHAERLGVYVGDAGCWGEVDVVAFETVGRVDEIVAVREAVAEVAGGKRFWISCVFPGEEGRLPRGETVGEVVEAMLGGEGGRPWGVGVNCTRVGKMRGLVEAFEKEVEGVLGEGTEWPALVLYPDGTRSGERYDSTLREWVVDEEGGEDGERPPEVSWHQEVGDVVEEARERGKWSTIVVGGCCRTGPEDIAMLRERFR